MNLQDVWRSIGGEVGFHTKETAHEIPDTPGVYAWILPLWLLKDDLDDFLHAVSTLHLYDPRATDGGHREAEIEFAWERVGVLLRREPKRGSPPAMRERWARMKENPALLDGFQAVLMRASILMPPLYVGQASSLRERYLQHVDSQRTGNTFNRRFTERVRGTFSLSVSDLVFACVKTQRNLDDALLAADLNDLLEHVLLHLARPPFSMR